MDLNQILANKEKSFIIAEIGQNHDGSLGMAHSYIDACSDIGINAIKFQTHIAEEESSLDDEFRTPYYDELTMETNIKGVFLAGVLCGGLKTNKWFIENSREHSEKIISQIIKV